MAATPIPLTFRGSKGARLTNTEVDTNFRSLSSAIQNVELGQPTNRRNYWKKAGPLLDDMGSASSNWTVFSGTVTRADSADYVLTHLGPSNALKINVGTGFARIHRSIAATVLTGTIDVWVYISSDPPVTASLNVLFSKDNFASYIDCVFTTGQYLRSGWNRLSVHVSEDGSTWSNGTAPAVTGSTSFADAMTHLRLGFNNFELASPTTGLPVSLYLGGIFYGGEAHANVLMGWDDAYSSQWEIFNIFRARELTGSVSVIPAAVGGGSGLSLSQLRTMYDWGWDVVNHTLHGTTGNIASDSDADVRTKIGGCQDWMLANGFSRTANVLVWPENAYNDRVIAIAEEYGITVMRGSKNRVTRTHQGIDNVRRLGSAPLSNKTLAQAKKYLDAAERYSGTQLIFGHKLIGTASSPAAGGAAPADGLDWYYNDYAALADDIAARVSAGTLTCINYSMLMANCRI